MRQLIDESIEFPVKHDTLVEQVGEVELTPPTGDSVTIGRILDTTDETTYQSAEFLYMTVVGNLDDTFIGRKHYDDRGGNHTLPDERSGVTF